MRFFFVYVFCKFQLENTADENGGKKQIKPRNAHGAMNQTATSLLGTKRFS